MLGFNADIEDDEIRVDMLFHQKEERSFAVRRQGDVRVSAAPWQAVLLLFLTVAEDLLI